jgi:hypothetical protein
MRKRRQKRGQAKKLAQALSVDEIDALVQGCLRQRPKRQPAVAAKPRVVEMPKCEMLPRSHFLPPVWQPPVTFQRKPLGPSPILRF